MLELPVGFFKLHDLHGQLCIASVLLAWCTSVGQVVLHTLFCKGLLWSTVQIILLQSPTLWVFCMPPCFLHSAQCFASFWDFLGIWSSKETIFFLEEPPPVAPALGPSCSFSVGKAFSMRSSASSGLITLCSTMLPVNLYWFCQRLGTVQRM